MLIRNILSQDMISRVKMWLVSFRIWLLLVLGVLIFLMPACVYYNTFYNARVYYQQGVKLAKTNPSTAKTNFEKAIAKSAVVVKNHFRSKWADDALFLVAMSYYHIGEYEKAIKNFEDFLTVFPNSPYRDEANYYQGMTYLAKQDYGLASLIFYDLKENSPRFAQASAYQIAYSFFLKEDYSTAKDSLFAFIKEYPKAKERKDAVLTLAEICFKLKQWADAIDWYQIALKELVPLIEPNEKATINLRRAECFLYKGNLDSAQVLLAQDYSRYPNLINQANLLSGKLLFAQEKDSLAREYLTRIKTGKEQAEAYYLLGWRYEQSKEFEKAMAYYDTASRAEPNSAAGINAKKRRSLLNHLYPSSEVKDSAAAQFMLGEIYGLVLNEYEQAYKEYEKTYILFPNSPYAPKALYAQAWLLKNRLKRTDYDTIYKILIDKYPKTVYANAARKELGLPEIKLLPKDTATGERLVKDSLAKFTQTETLSVRTTPTDTQKVQAKPESSRIKRKEEKIKQEVQPISTGSKENEEPILGEKSDQKESNPELISEEFASQTIAESLAQKEVSIASKLSPIHFDFDRYDIKSSDTIALKMAFNRLQTDSTLKITIEGYCDPIGSEQYNEDLGLKRALAAKNYLIQLGVSPKRITVKSFGEKRLVSTDYNEYWKNRRCEFVLQSEAKE